MKLGTKNFVYTSVIIAVLMALIFGYFVWMFPSLYVDYMRKQNYECMVEQHKAYQNHGEYDVERLPSSYVVTLELPMQEEGLKIYSNLFGSELTTESDELTKLLQEVKENVKNQFLLRQRQEEEKEDNDGLEKQLSLWMEKLKSILKQYDFPVKFQLIESEGNTFGDLNKDFIFHKIDDCTMAFESIVYNEEVHYTNYVAVTYDENRIIITFMPTMTPRISETIPIMRNSMPMILAVVVLLALVVSYLYSRGMVEPIQRLVCHIQGVEASGSLRDACIKVKGKDEIATLTQTLNHLYTELNQNYQALEEKNEQLHRKNQQQEVFLRASSHQLKTPIAAALLLVEGMLAEIGKYKDRDQYLKEVKKQLLTMRTMVEDVLTLCHMEEQLSFEEVDLNALLKYQMSQYEIQMQEGEFELQMEFEKECILRTDVNVLSKMIDNLISNAIDHSQKGARIQITTKATGLCIHNTKAHIPEELLASIYEPFVSSSGKGHGLGLYIVDYYAKHLGMQIRIENDAIGVLATLEFE